MSSQKKFRIYFSPWSQAVYDVIVFLLFSTLLHTDKKDLQLSLGRLMMILVTALISVEMSKSWNLSHLALNVSRSIFGKHNNIHDHFDQFIFRFKSSIMVKIKLTIIYSGSKTYWSK